MKVFAIGTTNPNSSEWSIWDEVSVVIAENEEKALILADESGVYSNEICEIPLDRQQVLSIAPEPNWGRDL